jgi:hypothetical protein
MVRWRIAFVALACCLIALSSAAASSARPLPFEVRAYQANFGVSSQRAEEVLEIQHAAAEVDIVGQLEAHLGRTYAGVWFDNESGEFVVPILRSADQKRVETAFDIAGVPEDFRTAPASSSWEMLELAQEGVTSEISEMVNEKRLAGGLVRTSINPRLNSVVVEEAEGVRAATQRRLRQEANSAPVRVSVREAEDLKPVPSKCDSHVKACDPPLRGGVAIGTLYQNDCTAAFKGVDDEGERYVLTAGHCFEYLNENVYADVPVIDPTEDARHEIGPVDKLYNGTSGADIARIHSNNFFWNKPSWPNQLVLWHPWWGEPPFNSEYSITSESGSYLGQSVCHVGKSTGTSCGYVRNVELIIESYPTSESEFLFNHITEAYGLELCIESGDSGGPVYAGHSAIGIVSSEDGAYTSCEPDCNFALCGQAVYYTEITEAADLLDVSVAPRVGGPPTAVSQITLEGEIHETLKGFEVADHRAKVVGKIDPNGLNTTYKIQYGTTTGYGSTVSYGSVGSGWSAIPVEGSISNLEGSTTYHYRFVAENSAGVSYGEDQTFTTPDWCSHVARELALVDCDGALHALYRQTDGNLGHQWLVKGSETWSGEVRPVSSMAGDPHSVIDTSGVFHVFYRQTDGKLGHQWIPKGGNWSGEVRPVSSMAGEPRVVVDGNGALHVLYRQTDGKLGHQWLVKGSETWSGEVLPAQMAGDPRVVIDTSSYFHVFYRQTDGNLGHKWIGPGGSSWGEEVRPVDSMAGDPRVIVDGDGALHALYRQTDGNLGHQWLVKGSETWSGEVRPVSSMAGDPQVMIDTSGVFHVFYRQTDGNLGHQWIPKGGNWSGVVHSASMAGSPRVIVDGNGALHVLYRQTDGNLGHQWLVKGSETWSGEVLPAQMAGDPHVLIDTSSYFHVFYRQIDGNLGHKWIGPGGSSWGEEVRPVSSMAGSPPQAGAGAAVEVEGGHATVKASVSPEGSITSYYFEYGPTTSYGSKQPVTAKSAGDGSGAFVVSEVLSGLSPGTTYHYRVVATNGSGTSKGSDATFSSVLPAAVTKAASAITAMQATLAASVNPKGFATNYSFEYGKTTSYGQSTANVSVGSGTEAVSVSRGITGLALGTTYHYRAKATSSQGTSYGQDTTFTTGTTESARAAFVDGGNANTISAWELGTGWQQATFMGHSVAAGTSPETLTVNGVKHVFFVDASNSNTLTDWTWNSSTGWQQTALWGHPVASGTSPSAVLVGSTIHVFFVDASNSKTITDWTWSSGTGWQQVPLWGHPVTAGSSPSAMMVNGYLEVFFSDAANSNSMTAWVLTPGGWQQAFLYGHPIATGTSPNAVMENSTPHVFFVDASNSKTITDWTWNSVTGWQQTALWGHPVATGSSPSAMMVNGYLEVFFADAANSNSITAWVLVPGSGWSQAHLNGHSVASGTSPSAAMNGSTPHVFFVDASNSNTLTDWVWNSVTGWQQNFLWGTQAATGSSPSAF